jgi:DNA-binding NarL/FixJ family response regulator
MPIKVLLLDDDASWRLLFRLMLKGDKNIEIAGEFETAEEALEQVPRLNPDVAVVDLSLPGMSGAEFVEKLRAFPAIRILVVTANDYAYVEGLRMQEVRVVDKTFSDRLLQEIKSICADKL